MERAPQLAQEVDDLRLQRHVERGRRLVGDEQVGIHEERHGDGDALAHPAGELVRVVIDALLRVGDADPAQHLDGARPLGGGGLAALAVLDVAPSASPTESTGLSAVIGSWKTIAISRAAQVAQLARRTVASTSRPLNRISPALDRGVGRQQANHRGDDGRLAAAALADQADDAPRAAPSGDTPRTARTGPAACRSATLRSRISSRWSLTASDAPPELRIEDVAQRLAEEGEAERRHDQRPAAGDDRARASRGCRRSLRSGSCPSSRVGGRTPRPEERQARPRS